MGQNCCESHKNMEQIKNEGDYVNPIHKHQNQNPPNINQPIMKENYVNTPTNIPVKNIVNDQLITPVKKEIKTNVKKEAQTIETSFDHSNIDRHVSIGSSVVFDKSQDNMDKSSMTKKSDIMVPEHKNDNKNQLITLNNNNFGGSNLYAELNPRTINKNPKDLILPLQCTKTIKAHQEKIVCLTELKSGNIATGSYDCTIKIWDLVYYECIKTINESGYVLCLLEFEDNMLLSGTNENIIQLWDINNNNCNQSICSFVGHELWVNCLIKCNDKYFASCSNDSDIRIWDYHLRKCANILKGHNDCVLTLIQLKDGRLCSGGADLTIKIWDWENANCDVTLTGHLKWVKCLCHLSNGYLASGSDDKTIKIWDEDNNEIKTLKGHNHSVRAICQLSEDLFASASFDRTIKIWDINRMECLQTLTGHTSNVIGIIHHSQGFLISCSNDQTIRIWNH